LLFPVSLFHFWGCVMNIYLDVQFIWAIAIHYHCRYTLIAIQRDILSSLIECPYCALQMSLYRNKVNLGITVCKNICCLEMLILFGLSNVLIIVHKKKSCKGNKPMVYLVVLFAQGWLMAKQHISELFTYLLWHPSGNRVCLSFFSGLGTELPR
jgi:hypothetical protein